MENLWPDSFQEDKRVIPKGFFEAQARVLPKITNNLVFAEVRALEENDVGFQMKGEFIYKFTIHGRYLKNYSFNLLTFSHDIQIYPVKFRLDSELSDEIGIDKSPFSPAFAIKNPDELTSFARKIFQSDRMKEIIGSIMRLSK